ncbi:RDD family protein [Aeromicrobium sp.]|uniref:RDD family protein n=1 Tax=Aeromicrobium sp. TaxID=1871063 RepID=UPI0030C05B08
MQTVSLGRRIGALFIDWIIAALSAAALTGSAYAGAGSADAFVPLGAFFVEVSLLTGLLGTTIGKRIFGLRVERPDGRGVGMPRAIVRTALLCLVIPALVMTDDKRGLHDLAAGTRVTGF